MASISPPTPHNLNFSIPKFPSRIPFYPSPSHSFSLCGCRCHHHNSSFDNSVHWRWDSALHEIVSTALKRFDSYFNSTKKEPKVVCTTAKEEEEEALERQRELGKLGGWKEHRCQNTREGKKKEGFLLRSKTTSFCGFFCFLIFNFNKGILIILHSKTTSFWVFHQF